MRHNKCYSKKLTKYQVKRHNQLKFTFLICLFTLMLLGNGLLALKTSPYKALGEQKELKGNNMPLSTSTALKSPNLAPQLTPVKAIRLITNKPDIEIKVREIAEKENFKWPEYLIKLANCESKMKPLSVNTVGNYPSTSYDRGLFQFNSHWQKKVSDECAFDLTCSTKKAIEMINNGQQDLWSCNKIVLAEK